MIEILLNLLAIISIFFIIYGYMKYNDLLINLIADFLIIVSTICIVFSIYLPLNQRIPAEISKSFTAPIILLSLLIILIYWLITQKKIPQISIKGIALLGISGALFRLISY